MGSFREQQSRTASNSGSPTKPTMSSVLPYEHPYLGSMATVVLKLAPLISVWNKPLDEGELDKVIIQILLWNHNCNCDIARLVQWNREITPGETLQIQNLESSEGPMWKKVLTHWASIDDQCEETRQKRKVAITDALLDQISPYHLATGIVNLENDDDSNDSSVRQLVISAMVQYFAKTGQLKRFQETVREIGSYRITALVPVDEETGDLDEKMVTPRWQFHIQRLDHFMTVIPSVQALRKALRQNVKVSNYMGMLFLIYTGIIQSDKCPENTFRCDWTDMRASRILSSIQIKNILNGKTIQLYGTHELVFRVTGSIFG